MMIQPCASIVLPTSASSVVVISGVGVASRHNLPDLQRTVGPRDLPPICRCPHSPLSASITRFAWGQCALFTVPRRCGLY